MKKFKYLVNTALVLAGLYTVAWAANLPPSIPGDWQAALVDVFTQKAGTETISGAWTISGAESHSNSVTFVTLNKDVVAKTGSVSAQGLAGTIAFQTGVLDTISNATVTATTLCFIQKADGSAPLANSFSCTNQVGIGIKIIPSTACTNTLAFRLIQTN